MTIITLQTLAAYNTSSSMSMTDLSKNGRRGCDRFYEISYMFYTLIIYDFNMIDNSKMEVFSPY